MSSDAGIVVVGMDPIIRPYSATAIQEWGRAILGKTGCIIARTQRMISLIGCDDSSLVIDKLCDEAVDEDAAVACFYFDFAA